MRIGITLTSSMHVGDEYIELTKNISKTLASNGYGIVFGGTDYGMMSTLATTYKENRGLDLVGVMAKDLAEVTKGYIPFADLDEAIWCETMGARKETIIKKSDAFLILPGGYGTIEELGDIFGGKVNKLYDKPIALYNFRGYYNTLIAFFDELFAKEFSKVKFSDIVCISENLEGILNYYETYTKNEVADKFEAKI
jgi:cytokinin riboside 5'-monophosphate phosphoribohydrolase